MSEKVSEVDIELSMNSSLFMIFLNAVFAAICIFIFGMMLGLDIGRGLNQKPVAVEKSE